MRSRGMPRSTPWILRFAQDNKTRQSNPPARKPTRTSTPKAQEQCRRGRLGNGLGNEAVVAGDAGGKSRVANHRGGTGLIFKVGDCAHDAGQFPSHAFVEKWRRRSHRWRPARRPPHCRKTYRTPWYHRCPRCNSGCPRRRSAPIACRHCLPTNNPPGWHRRKSRPDQPKCRRLDRPHHHGHRPVIALPSMLPRPTMTTFALMAGALMARSRLASPGSVEIGKRVRSVVLVSP